MRRHQTAQSASARTLIAMTLWYFFGPRARTTASRDAAGLQKVAVTVKAHRRAGEDRR
jgi:hypothetical protein